MLKLKLDAFLDHVWKKTGTKNARIVCACVCVRIDRLEAEGDDRRSPLQNKVVGANVDVFRHAFH